MQELRIIQLGKGMKKELHPSFVTAPKSIYAIANSRNRVEELC
jgi:hypothetical protein